MDKLFKGKKILNITKPVGNCKNKFSYEVGLTKFYSNINFNEQIISDKYPSQSLTISFPETKNFTNLENC